MKKFLFILFIGVFVSTYATAQSKKDLKGPKAKNYKHWKHDDQKKTVLFTSESTPKGPAAKNQKPWKNTPATIEREQLVDLSGTRTKVTGPKAKNSRPWELVSQDSVEQK